MNCSIETNSDITGVGNRVAIYIGNLLMPIAGIAFASEVDLIIDMAHTSIVTSCALIVASFVTRATVGLTLVDAQVVSYLTTFTTLHFQMEVLLGGLGSSIQIGYAVLVILDAVFNLIVYANPSTYGGALYQPGCNNLGIFVIFGASISSTNRGLQIVNLLGRAISLFIAVVSMSYSIFVWISSNGTAADEGDTGSMDSDIIVFRIGARISGLLGTIFTIIMVELMISRNGLRSQANQWAFGQVLAMFMIADLLWKIGEFIRKKSRAY